MSTIGKQLMFAAAFALAAAQSANQPVQVRPESDGNRKDRRAANKAARKARKQGKK